MTLGVLAALLVVGLLVGFVSGLIGIGGGVLIVPFLYFFYAHPAWAGLSLDPSLQATIAHATSLAVILPTGLAAAAAHHRARLVAWRAALPIAGVAIVAAIVGAQLALLMPAALLKTLFGLLLIGSGVNLTRNASGHAREELHLSPLVVITTGGTIGLLSAMMGVGGGIVAIPMLLYVVGVDMRRVAATSIAIVGLTAASGTVAYALAGLGVPGRPEGSVGFIHLVAALPILLASLATVRLGAYVNQRMHTRHLRVLFAVLFVLLGFRLVLVNAGRLF